MEFGSKRKIINVFSILFVVGVVGFITTYYLNLWGENSANNAKGQEQHSVDVELPANHPDIYANMDSKFPAENKHCLSCHQGIEPSRPLGFDMMKQILAIGEKQGDPNGCVVCHGGNPSEVKNKDRAHSGVPSGSKLKAFTPVPGALQVNDNTCGQCHADHTYSVHRSIMNTDAGKMKAITWSWGIGTESKDHIYGDHDIDDPDGDVPRFGTDKYKQYMKEMAIAFPGQYPKKLVEIPEVSLSKLSQMPEQAAFTYLRNCNACHLSNKGYQDRGHYRGMGCAACHSLYSVEGYYEGKDTSINKRKPGHLLVHTMQGTRKTKIKLNGKQFSGIQVSTCAACHAAGRRIGHAYQGLMAYGHEDHRGPFDAQGGSQKPNAGYVYKYIRNDAHHRIDKDGKSVTGLLCQDCHTTNAMHGNGNIGATTLATVEIECADCHGTPKQYPWELPIGYGDEFNKKLDMRDARGLSDVSLKVTSDFATVYPKGDGYLLSARGNPLGNVVRKGNNVVVHSATGHDFEVPLLKSKALNKSWKSPLKAHVAMEKLDKHMEKLECYACHSTWAAQYYGFKHVIDYTKTSIDWLNSPEKFSPDGTTADYHSKYVMQPGGGTNWDYSHTRWETPPLGINGEGRVTPLTGVIQTIGTVIGPDGKTIVWNHTPKTKDGYNAMELAPLQPHTTSLAARECSDCHGSNVAIGYGTDGGVYDSQPQIERYLDVVGGDGENISQYTESQVHAIAQLHGDFTKLLDSEGVQLQTIDTHWPTSMPLTKEQRDVLERSGTCIACHQDISDNDIPINMLRKIAKIANLSYRSSDKHDDIISENSLMISWVKALGVIALLVAIPLLIILFVKREKVITFLRKLKDSFNKKNI